jgi:hypothetical protein
MPPGDLLKDPYGGNIVEIWSPFDRHSGHDNPGRGRMLVVVLVLQWPRHRLRTAYCTL